MRRDYELVTAEKDRLMKLIEQLKHEKKQLVETVLHLSNEVDAAHKSVDQLATDRMRHVQTDAMIRSARRRLGLQIIGVLEARGVTGDDPLMKVRACMCCLVWSGPIFRPPCGHVLLATPVTLLGALHCRCRKSVL